MRDGKKETPESESDVASRWFLEVGACVRLSIRHALGYVVCFNTARLLVLSDAPFYHQ